MRKRTGGAEAKLKRVISWWDAHVLQLLWVCVCACVCFVQLCVRPEVLNCVLGKRTQKARYLFARPMSDTASICNTSDTRETHT